MKRKINSINIYYGNLNKLLLECVNPTMETILSKTHLWFWERSAIGGKHLKLRWVADSERDFHVKKTLTEQISKFQAEYPSISEVNYKHSAVKRIAETEKRNIPADDFQYKVDCLVEKPYERLPDDDMSDELIEILHEFLSDTRSLCNKIIESGIDQKFLGLQLLAVFSFAQFGSLQSGCITFRAHWDNYENWFKPDILPKRIKEHYQANKTELHKIIQVLMRQNKAGKLLENELFSDWIKIINKYNIIVSQKQTDNIVFIPNATTVEGVIATSNYLNEQNTQSRSETFLRRLYSKPDYLGNLSVNKGLQLTRIMVNLVYHLISNIGISAFQRMSYCYFLHRSVEEILNIDLLDNLDEQMNRVLGENIGIAESEFVTQDLS
jgi:Lantibiotic biosynthesis dehydratase C-term